MRPGISWLAGLVVAACAAPDLKHEAPSPPGLFAERWNSGLEASEPAFHVQRIDSNTFAIRQSLRTTFEAPFVYLLLGTEKALLIDTGDAGADLRVEIDGLIKDWLSANGRESVSLVVMHSHGHGDHIGGDASFENRPNTDIVGHTAQDVADFFGLRDWPTEPAVFDLGGRFVDILPAPGHHDSHVMVFDTATGVLFSGDAIYPGRLYFKCEKAGEFRASIDRVAAFAAARDVSWILGGHIEMTAVPGKTFDTHAPARENERRLELTASVITDIQYALADMGAEPRVTGFDEFVLFPHPADPAGKSPPDWCLGQGPK